MQARRPFGFACAAIGICTHARALTRVASDAASTGSSRAEGVRAFSRSRPVPQAFFWHQAVRLLGFPPTSVLPAHSSPGCAAIVICTQSVAPMRVGDGAAVVICTQGVVCVRVGAALPL